MKPRIPLLLLLAVLVLATAGCIQPSAEPNPGNETGFNISAVERDPVREAAAQAAHFTGKEILEQIQDPEYLEYKQFMNQTDNTTYFDYLVHSYPESYQYYRGSHLNMSFIAYLERYYTDYPYSLNHDYQFVPFRLHEPDRIDPGKKVVHLTKEEVENNPILRSYFIDAPGYGLKVLPSEETQLDPYRGAYLEWNGTRYQQIRSIV